MNNLIEQEAVEILKLAKEGLLQAVNLAQEQFPDLCQQILAYGFWANIGAVLFACFLLAIGIALIIIDIKVWKASIASGFSLVFFIISITTLAISTTLLIQITLAPKLYLLEYLKGLVN